LNDIPLEDVLRCLHAFVFVFMNILEQSGRDGEMLTRSVNLELVLQTNSTKKSKQDQASMTIRRYTMGEGVVITWPTTLARDGK